MILYRKMAIHNKIGTVIPVILSIYTKTEK